jgi:DNA-binding response OmpR family regulator
VARLLLVEDDEAIGRRVDAALRANGHNVVWQRTGGSALIEATRTSFDLVLLDLGLPDRDGVEVCRDLRVRQPGCVLVMLTARREEMDVVVGLEAGADDYITKPFGMTELIARIRAHLRRLSADGSAPSEVFSDGDLVLDPHARRCSVGGAVSREVLMADVWDENWFGSTKTLDVHIAAVRRRLDAAAGRTDPPARVPGITTLRGHGYRLDLTPQAAHPSPVG